MYHRSLPVRTNCYDGVEEYWVTVRETGSREESVSQEERKTAVSEASGLQTCLREHSRVDASLAAVKIQTQADKGVDFSKDAFSGLQAMNERNAVKPQEVAKLESDSKFFRAGLCQTP